MIRVDIMIVTGIAKYIEQKRENSIPESEASA